MSFGIYLLGFLIVIGGLIYGGMKGVQATRGKDPS